MISDSLFDNLETYTDSAEHLPIKSYTAPSGNPMLTIIDRNGVFDFEVVFCVCCGSTTDDHNDEQLLRSGLFPATFKSIKTVFTFSVLDDFLKDNLECKTTAQQYYSKLQSTTSKMFPNRVPVCCIHNGHIWELTEIYRICIDSFYVPLASGEILKIEWSRDSDFNQNAPLQMEQWQYFAQHAHSQE